MKRLFTPEERISAINLEPFAILIQRKFVPSHIGKRSACLCNCFFLNERILNLFGQQQDITDAFLALCDGNALLPFIVFTSESGGERCA